MSSIERRLGAIEDTLADHHRHLIHISNRLEDIMSAISDFAAKMTAFFDRQDADMTALKAEFQALVDQIAALQNSPGAITPADQALLDGIQTRAGVFADNLDAFSAVKPPVAPAA